MMNPTPPENEPVWTFRGYQLKASEFNTAMVHFFRAEVQRANVWRQRLDTTTNWAVVTTGAALTYSFNDGPNTHLVILINLLLVTMFLTIEARRYRFYEVWSSRVRLMETDFYAAMLVPPFRPAADWGESLAENLLHPHFTISFWEALGRRYRRNYIWIYAILAVAWMAKLILLPEPAANFAEVVSRAAIGTGGGEVVFTGWALFNVLLLVTGILTSRLHEATGEVLPQFDLGTVDINGKEEDSKKRAWFRYTRRRQQLMAWIISNEVDPLTKRILAEMRRGLTKFEGEGQYTHAKHPVLMCALTVTEVPHLKSIVSEVDPNAFLIVTPAAEILGKGFVPLKEK